VDLSGRVCKSEGVKYGIASFMQISIDVSPFNVVYTFQILFRIEIEIFIQRYENAFEGDGKSTAVTKGSCTPNWGISF
jgi:hypothetical protein